jgi:thioesterase domain-containing protein
MTAAELETYLHDHIPLSRAMAVHVVSVAEASVVLGAPLAPNINHRDTVFGGSAAAVATLAAWSLLHLRLTAAGLPSRVVIQHSTMDYLAPMAGDFTATGTLAPAADWDGFVRLLTRRGRARIALEAELTCAGQQGGLFRGEFVAFGKDRL